MHIVIRNIIQKKFNEEMYVLICQSDDEKWFLPEGLMQEGELISNAAQRIIFKQTRIDALVSSILDKSSQDDFTFLYVLSNPLNEHTFLPNDKIKKIYWSSIEDLSKFFEDSSKDIINKIVDAIKEKSKSK
mgnify:CR=1 FL=1